MQAALKPQMLATKPLIMFVLLGYFISVPQKQPRGLTTWVIVAILFSMAGDTLLLFQADNPQFFLFGLSAFLVAHIGYIVFFHRLRITAGIRFRPALIPVVAIYYAALIWLLYPGLQDMKIPVIVYGLVISTMCLLALHMLFLQQKNAGRLMMTGALLFVLSDSILAVDRFYRHFDAAGLFIMLTYGAAQLFIIKGAAESLTGKPGSIDKAG